MKLRMSSSHSMIGYHFVADAVAGILISAGAYYIAILANKHYINKSTSPIKHAA